MAVFNWQSVRQTSYVCLCINKLIMNADLPGQVQEADERGAEGKVRDHMP